MPTKVKDVMDKNLILISTGTSCQEVLRLILESGEMKAAIVKEGEEYVGIVTATDFIRIIQGLKHRNELEKIPIENIMSEANISVSPEDDLSKALGFMRNLGIRHIVATQYISKLGVVTPVGIISQMSVLRWWADGT